MDRFYIRKSRYMDLRKTSGVGDTRKGPEDVQSRDPGSSREITENVEEAGERPDSLHQHARLFGSAVLCHNGGMGAIECQDLAELRVMTQQFCNIYMKIFREEDQVKRGYLLLQLSRLLVKIQYERAGAGDKTQA
jgi:hypothetical protein